jgi:hypothetical protein
MFLDYIKFSVGFLIVVIVVSCAHALKRNADGSTCEYKRLVNGYNSCPDTF